MNWRFWPRAMREVRDNPVARALYIKAGRIPQWTKREYARLAREGYTANATIYACVREISIAQAGIPWFAYEKSRLPKGKGQPQPLENHPVLDLLERPNPLQGQGTFIETVAAYLQIDGNSYVTAAGPAREGAPPKELWPLRPDRMSIDPHPVTIVGQYVYLRDEAGERRFEPKQILHRRYFHPTNDFYGLSPLAVAQRAMDQDNAAQAWNYSLLKEGGRVSGALVTKRPLGSTQREILRADVREELAGPSNAGRILLLEGDLEWQDMGLSLKDADWGQGRRMSMLDICKAFAVPPELVGDSEHKIYNNYREARRALYEEKILPEMDNLRDDLNNWLTRMWDDRLRLDYDKDQIEALQETQETLWARAESAWWLTLNQRLEMIGYEPIGAQGEVLFIPSGLIPVNVSSLAAMAALPDETEEPEDEDVPVSSANGNGNGNRSHV